MLWLDWRTELDWLRRWWKSGLGGRRCCCCEDHGALEPGILSHFIAPGQGLAAEVTSCIGGRGRGWEQAGTQGSLHQDTERRMASGVGCVERFPGGRLVQRR